MEGATEDFWCSHSDYWCSGSRVLCCSMVRSLVLCQDLAGSWDAWHECGAVNARVQWSQWLSDSEEGVVAQTRQRMRGKQ